MTRSRNTIIRRLRGGLGAQGIKQGVNLFVRLAEVPLLLAFWGPARYGEWLMVAAIPAYLAMADGGFTGATQREMTIRMGGGDREGALAAFQSTWVLLLVVSFALMVLAGATTLCPFSEWLGLKSMPGKTFSAVVMLFTAHIALGFQCGLIYGGYSCEGRYARGTILTAALYLFDFVGLAIAVLLGSGPVGAAAGFLIGRIVGLVIFLIDLPRVAPWLRFGWANASREQVTGLFRPSLASMAFPLGQALNIQGVRLVVGLVLGPMAVAIFSTIRTLCRSAMKPVLVVAQLVEPEMALAYGSGRIEDMRDLLKRSSQVTLWAALPICVVLWFLGAPLLKIWTAGRIGLDVSLYSLLLLASVAHSTWFTALMVSYATNRHGRTAVIFAVANAGLVVAVDVLTARMGVSGAGIGILLFETAMAFWVLPESFRLSGETFLGWAEVTIRPPFNFVKRMVLNKG